VVGDVEALLEPIEIDLLGSLSPLESVLVREEHAFPHFLEPPQEEGIPHESGVVARADEAEPLWLNHLLLGLIFGFEVGRIEVILVVVLIEVED